MGQDYSLPNIPHSTYMPPVPAIAPTGPNGALTWADLSVFLKGDSQKLVIDKQQKNINRIIHWIGTIQGFDNSKKQVFMKMNPSLNTDPNSHDVIITLPIATDSFASEVGKDVDFTGQITGIQHGVAFVNYLNYEVGPEQLSACPVAGDVNKLNSDLQIPLSWVDYIKDAFPDVLGTIVQAFSQQVVALTCQIVSIEGLKITGKLLPKISSNKGIAYDMIATFTADVKVPPTVKQDSICSIFGKIVSLDQKLGFINLSCSSIIHHNNPNACLEKLPQTGGKVNWEAAMGKIKQLKALSEQTTKMLADIRGIAVSRPRSELSTPMKDVVGESVIKEKVADAIEPEVEENKEDEIVAQEVVEDQVVEPKKDSIYDEVTGKVRLDEPESEFKSMDPMEVAALLMRDAPKTSYTETAISANLLNEDEDDALKRIRALKQSGLFNHFTESADKHLEELGQFKGSAGDMDDYAGGTNYYDEKPATNYYTDNNDNYYNDNTNYDYNNTDYNSNNYYNDQDTNNQNNYDYNNYDNNGNNGW